MRIIAAMDIIDGACVRLLQGDYSKRTTYDRKPLEMAREMEDNGIKYLHLVDLDGARKGEISNYKVLETIAGKTNLKTDFSGGIRSDDDLSTAFSCGASQVTCGSIAVTEPALFLRWLDEYGTGKIILGADFRKRRVAIAGWQSASVIDIAEFLLKYRSEGVVYASCTDIDKDGMMEGPAIDIYKELAEISGLSVIASGGVTCVDDIKAISKTGCEGVIIGKAIYEGKITLKELSGLC